MFLSGYIIDYLRVAYSDNKVLHNISGLIGMLLGFNFKYEIEEEKLLTNNYEFGKNKFIFKIDNENKPNNYEFILNKVKSEKDNFNLIYEKKEPKEKISEIKTKLIIYGDFLVENGMLKEEELDKIKTSKFGMYKYTPSFLLDVNIPIPCNEIEDYINPCIEIFIENVKGFNVLSNYKVNTKKGIFIVPDSKELLEIILKYVDLSKNWIRYNPGKQTTSSFESTEYNYLNFNIEIYYITYKIIETMLEYPVLFETDSPSIIKYLNSNILYKRENYVKDNNLYISNEVFDLYIYDKIFSDIKNINLYMNYLPSFIYN